MLPLLLAMLILPSSASAAKKGASGRIIVFDVTGRDTLENRAFLFELKDRIEGYPDLEKALNDCVRDTAGTGKLLGAIRENGGRSTRRWISYKGDVALIYTFKLESYDLNLTFDEKGRETQLGSDVATLFKAIAKKQEALPEKEGVIVSKSTRRLEKTRATLIVRASPSRAEELAAGFAGLGLMFGDNLLSSMDENQRAKTKVTLASAEISLTTGPREHWYLSTSVPLTTVKELQYLDSTGTFEPHDKPKKFLIGANFLLGDVLSEEHSVLGGLAPGVFVEASSKPFESFGVSLSYRFPAREAFGLEFDLVSPFWGLIRTTSDTRTESGAIERGEHVVYKGVWGLSLNLDKVASWLNGK